MSMTNTKQKNEELEIDDKRIEDATVTTYWNEVEGKTAMKDLKLEQAQVSAILLKAFKTEGELGPLIELETNINAVACDCYYESEYMIIKQDSEEYKFAEEFLSMKLAQFTDDCNALVLAVMTDYDEENDTYYNYVYSIDLTGIVCAALRSKYKLRNKDKSVAKD